jgi:flavin-dependent dehydrogenase
MIVPLCGNGMSMAMHAASLITQHASQYLNNKMNINTALSLYYKDWNKNFNSRMRMGRLYQQLFYNEGLLNSILPIVNKSEYLKQKLISLTHGKSFG